LHAVSGLHKQLIGPDRLRLRDWQTFFEAAGYCHNNLPVSGSIAASPVLLCISIVCVSADGTSLW